MDKVSTSQSLVLESASSSSPGNLLDMQILRGPHYNATEISGGGALAINILTCPPVHAGALSNLGTTEGNMCLYLSQTFGVAF